MSGVYLSLNMGWTQFRDKYQSEQEAGQQIEATAKKCLETLQSGIDDFSPETINLLTRGQLGKGYQLGHICGTYYPSDKIPDDNVLVDDLRNLMGVYRGLKDKLQTDDITKLIEVMGEAVVSESDADDAKYNRAVQTASQEKTPCTPQPIPHYLGGKKWKTNPGIGKDCIIDTDYKYEVNSTHNTFIARVTNENFVEVHHLVPMSYQEEFEASLDVSANIIALCPNCHRLLHHAREKESSSRLRLLFDKRQSKMGLFGISLSVEKLLRYYKKNNCFGLHPEASN